MANFDIEFPQLIKTEGGYANDPDDRGGETYKGIARNANPKWVGWTTIDQIKKAHPKDFRKILDATPELQDKVKTFYKSKYWDCFCLDDVPSQKLAHQMFDHGVNAGQSRAIGLMQKILGMTVTNKWSEELLYNMQHYD